MITNLWHILWKAPQIIGIIRAILDIVGSAQVQKILETIRDAVKEEVPYPPKSPPTEEERKGLVRRMFRRLAFKSLNMSEQEYTAFCNLKQKENIA